MYLWIQSPDPPGGGLHFECSCSLVTYMSFIVHNEKHIYSHTVDRIEDFYVTDEQVFEVS